MNVNITVYCIMSFNTVYLFIYISDEDFSMIAWKISSCRNKWKFFSFQPLKIPYLYLHCLPHVKKYVLGRLRHLPLARKELCLSSELSSSFMTTKALWLRQARKSVLKGPFRLQVLLRTVRYWPKSNERRLHIIISYEVENTFTFCNIHKFECTRLFWFGRL